MGSLFKKLKGIRNEMIIMAVVLILAGLFMVLFPNTSGKLICRGVGAILCIWGAMRLIGYFRNSEVLGSFGLVQGAALAGFGLYILIRPQIIEVFLTTVFAIVIIVDGLLKMQYALDFRRLNVRNWWIELVCSVIMIILGAVVLFNPFATVAAVMLFIGIVLVFEGAWDLVSVLYISKLAKEVKDDFERF